MDLSTKLRSFIKNEEEIEEALQEIHPHIRYLHQQCCISSFSTNKVSSDDLIHIEYVLSYLHDLLNIGKWTDVSETNRQAYTASSFIKALLLLLNNEAESTIKEAVKTIDKGYLLGLPLKQNVDILTESAQYLNSLVKRRNVDIQENRVIKRTKVDNSECIDGKCVESVTNPSLEHFYKTYFIEQRPVVIKEAINHWPALSKWTDINYILNIAGERTVPIEIGSSYSGEDFSQKLMTLREFVNDYYMNEESSEIGYLAQHDLLNQIPQLQEDIRTPVYCCLSRNDNDSESDPEINAWFGPKNTVSSLHFDPKDNLLCQVYGSKLVLLFAPRDSEYLYPHSGILSNTAKVDPRRANLEKFPLFCEATMYKCTVNAGEMLYIPPKWWHHVTALQKSFSVNFWWQ